MVDNEYKITVTKSGCPCELYKYYHK